MAFRKLTVSNGLPVRRHRVEQSSRVDWTRWKDLRHKKNWINFFVPGWKAIPEMLCNERIVYFICQHQMWKLWSGDSLRRTRLTCCCRCSTTDHVCNRCLVNKRLHSYHNSQIFCENGLANYSELSPSFIWKRHSRILLNPLEPSHLIPFNYIQTC